MYPNLYYLVRDWFGVELKGLEFLNMFGLMVAISFVVSAIVLRKELQRKEKQGLLLPREETITVGKPASAMDLILNGVAGFLFGFKIGGLFFDKPADVSAQDYIFSAQGHVLSGLLLAAVLVAMKWYEKKKQKLKTPEQRNVRIWPHDRVGDFAIIALVLGILGAKVFDNLENWDDFIKDPIGRLFAPAGLTFYGGLIVAAIGVCWYAVKKGVKLIHLLDAAGPALMIAYAVGRIGCQVAGDGDWGIHNSAYVNDSTGKVILAAPGDYQKNLQQHADYFLRGKVKVPNKDSMVSVAGAQAASLEQIKHASFKAPAFLPVWMVAYNYPKNVNADGVFIPGDNDEHNKVLPQPVFPTPFYEVIMGTLLFLLLMALRKRIKTAGVLFGIYLVVNGLERFLIEKIRVNTTYDISPSFQPTQAELISAGLVIAGLVLILYRLRKKGAEG
jgi:phosphatidylglycerol---prolipoprotein diacylglyceryl transferase